ncbi:MAG: (d)CMP kinase [Alphaproteobacteria bacterium]|nr:(d)CMP kinase [Alphaproteobacteria bacterium]
MIIAVDGPSAAGKGTLARRLAAHFDYAYLDTGSLYRALALSLRAAGTDPQDADAAAAAARALDLDLVDSPRLRDDDIAAVASVVAAYPEVRRVLNDVQRRFAASPPGGKAGAVIDGRDIGTVVCPDADAKIFVTASAEARARRRHKELIDGGQNSIYARVLQDLTERDARDSGRDVAPLKVAIDAFMLDTTDLDADAAFEATLAYLKSRNG